MLLDTVEVCVVSVLRIISSVKHKNTCATCRLPVYASNTEKSYYIMAVAVLNEAKPNDLQGATFFAFVFLEAAGVRRSRSAVEKYKCSFYTTYH